MNFKFYSSWCAVAALAVAGCGGSGNSGSVDSREVERDYGSVTTRAAGAVGPPLNVSTNNLTVAGLAGASFSLARLNFPPISALNNQEVIERSQIAVSAGGQPAVYDMGTGAFIRISRENADIAQLRTALSPLGDRMYVTEQVQVNGNWIYRIYQVNSDGSGKVYMLPQTDFCFSPDVSPDGSRIAFMRYAGGQTGWQLCTMPATPGAAVTVVATSQYLAVRPQWSPEGTKIAFMQSNPSDSRFDVKVVNIDGTGLTNFGTRTTSTIINSFDYTPTGELAVSYSDGNTYYLGRYRKTGGPLRSIASSPNSLGSISVSPEGSQVSFTGDAAGAVDLFTMSIDGGERTKRTTNGLISETSWGPYIRAKSLIGNGGAISAGAGYLLAQKGKRFPSYVVFDATTRSGVTLESSSQPVQTNLVVTIKATDNLTALRYGNNLFAPAIVAISTSSTASGAMVSFDTASGEIASIIPFVGSVPAIRSSRGSERVYEGRILGIWDRKGNNLAPDGATAVTLDANGDATP